MTTLSDLPSEVLTAIFREFQSKELVNHSYLCKWDVEPKARRTRANLCALALVSRRLSAIAVPLLYEQLFSCKDFDKISSNAARYGTGFKSMAPVRYLAIATDDSPTEGSWTMLMARVKDCLVHCVDISHLYLWVSGTSSDISAFIQNLAQLPALQRLQSLSITFHKSKNRKHTLFRDCSHFRSLVGLYIFTRSSDRSMGGPEHSLHELKQLEIMFMESAQDLFECMALASPKHLEILRFYALACPSPIITSVIDVCGQHIWERLTYLALRVYTPLDRNIFVTSSERLPILQKLDLGFRRDLSLRESIPNLPYGLKHFVIAAKSMAQLLECLMLFMDNEWPSRNIQRIRIGFDESEGPWSRQMPYRRAHLRRIVDQATRSKGITLETQELLDKLDMLDLLRYEDAEV